MFDTVLRKGRQLAADPVLRRWLMARALARTPAEPVFTPHRPPYLGAEWRLGAERPSAHFAAAPAEGPVGEIVVRLAGEQVRLRPGDEAAFVRRTFADMETQLSLHRFAWVPLMEAGDDPRWVASVWSAWVEAQGADVHGIEASWAWHPYTAAERAINLLDFSRRHFLPGPAERTLPVLAAHAPAIAAGLEWFGDHHTSNHCANNGRGLYLLGLALGLEQAAAAGARILMEEGARIFRPSGVLREASVHYHLLLTRQWASVWLAARSQGRPERAAFEAVLTRAFAVLPSFDLPGGVPLVGDVSPDCPPAHLLGLIPGRDSDQGWTGLLPADERAALVALRDGAGRVEPAALLEDGWLRHDAGPWSGLWHAEPDGWSPMPGHGHQDCGAAEIHFQGEPIFVDPGRGSYAAAGEADFYVSSGAHSGLTLDGADPYPPNRPYYAPSFRTAVAGPARLAVTAEGVTLAHGGYGARGRGQVVRTWRFDALGLVLDDRVDGKGAATIVRRLVTPLAAAVAGDAVILTTASGGRLRVAAEAGTTPTLGPLTLWSAYGEGRPGTVLTFAGRNALPWTGRLVVEVL